MFDFGENWKNYSERALSVKLFKIAKTDFLKLSQGYRLKNRSFLDIGFGQGLVLLIAADAGAKVVGCEINVKLKSVFAENKRRFFKKINYKIPIIIGSILDEKVVKKIKANCPNRKTKKFDFVYSWGVLHHTGKMWEAIEKSCCLVNKKGHLIISIYNRHWSSPFWKIIKYVYNFSPEILRRLMIIVFYLIIAIVKFAFLRKNPFVLKRGMNFYYNVIDWVGGYPYEYASTKEIKKFVEQKGFKLVKLIKAEVPTGCNEFIFKK